jgi:hypothetical protein
MNNPDESWDFLRLWKTIMYMSICLVYLAFNNSYYDNLP